MSFLSRRPSRPDSRGRGADRGDEYGDYDYAPADYDGEDENWSPGEYFSPGGIKGRWADGRSPGERARGDRGDGGRGRRTAGRGDSGRGYDDYADDRGGYDSGGYDDYGSRGGYDDYQSDAGGYEADEYAMGAYDLPEGADDDRGERGGRRRRDRESRGERTGILRLRRDKSEDIWPDDGISDEDYWASVAADRPLSSTNSPFDADPLDAVGDRPVGSQSRTGGAAGAPGERTGPGNGAADSWTDSRPGGTARFGTEQRGGSGGPGRLGPAPGLIGEYQPAGAASGTMNGSGGRSGPGSHNGSGPVNVSAAGMGGPGQRGGSGPMRTPSGPGAGAASGDSYAPPGGRSAGPRQRTGPNARQGSGPGGARSGSGSGNAWPDPSYSDSAYAGQAHSGSARADSGQPDRSRPGLPPSDRGQADFLRSSGGQPTFKPNGSQRPGGTTGSPWSPNGTGGNRQQNGRGYGGMADGAGSAGGAGAIRQPDGRGYDRADRSERTERIDRVNAAGYPEARAGAPGPSGALGGPGSPGRGPVDGADRRPGDRRDPGRDAGRLSGAYPVASGRAGTGAAGRSNADDDPLTSTAFSRSAMTETDGRSYRVAARRSQAQVKLTDQASAYLATGNYYGTNGAPGSSHGTNGAPGSYGRTGTYGADRNGGDQYAPDRYGSGQYGTRQQGADKYNTGSYNTGSYDTGSYDTGSYDTGSYDTGQYQNARYSSDLTGAYSAPQFSPGDYQTGGYAAFRSDDRAPTGRYPAYNSQPSGRAERPERAERPAQRTPNGSSGPNGRSARYGSAAPNGQPAGDPGRPGLPAGGGAPSGQYPVQQPRQAQQPQRQLPPGQQLQPAQQARRPVPPHLPAGRPAGNAPLSAPPANAAAHGGSAGGMSQHAAVANTAQGRSLPGSNATGTGISPAPHGGQNPYDSGVTGSYPYPGQPYTARPAVAAAPTPTAAGLDGQDGRYYQPTAADGYGAANGYGAREAGIPGTTSPGGYPNPGYGMPQDGRY